MHDACRMQPRRAVELEGGRCRGWPTVAMGACARDTFVFVGNGSKALARSGGTSSGRGLFCPRCLPSSASLQNRLS